jgi:hypothetical protein
MPADGLPEDGAPRVGSVSLPPGRRIIPWHGSDPVAWATDQANRGIGAANRPSKTGGGGADRRTDG